MSNDKKNFGNFEYLNFDGFNPQVAIELDNISQYIITNGLSFVITTAENNRITRGSTHNIFESGYHQMYKAAEAEKERQRDFTRYIYEEPIRMPDIPKRSYSGKGNLKVKGLGDLTVVLFRSGDATGNDEDRNGQNSRPGMPKHLTPRFKEGYAEIFLSVGTGYNNLWFPGLTSLEAVTIGPGEPESHVYKRLICEEKKFLDYLTRPRKIDDISFNDRIAFTFLEDDKESFGNPHCIRFNNQLVPRNKPLGNIFQIGAFLGFQTETPELNKLRGIIGK
jgi:hypothetical protein